MQSVEFEKSVGVTSKKLQNAVKQYRGCSCFQKR